MTPISRPIPHTIFPKDTLNELTYLVMEEKLVMANIEEEKKIKDLMYEKFEEECKKLGIKRVEFLRKAAAVKMEEDEEEDKLRGAVEKCQRNLDEVFEKTEELKNEVHEQNWKLMDVIKKGKRELDDLSTKIREYLAAEVHSQIHCESEADLRTVAYLKEKYKYNKAVKIVVTGDEGARLVRLAASSRVPVQSSRVLQNRA